ncbi:MAG: ABC transporter ATP-binding protein [Lachnospiraceae bacterium]
MAELRVENISKSFDGTMFLEDVSLHLAQGELVCLLGVSGVGKTTLFNVISGLLQPDAGHVFLNEREITGQAGNISYMLQKDLLLPFKTIEDNIALPLLVKGSSKKDARKEVSGYLAEFGLEGTQKQFPNQLSGGMRQRAALLRTYMFSKEIALLDEPFSALDTLTRGALQQWYLTIMEQIKLSTLFITHDIDEAIMLSDRIYLLSGRPGRITHEFIIREPKPRDKEFNVTERFLEYKREILSCLETQEKI